MASRYYIGQCRSVCRGRLCQCTVVAGRSQNELHFTALYLILNALKRFPLLILLFFLNYSLFLAFIILYFSVFLPTFLSVSSHSLL